MTKMTGRKALFESLKLQGVEYIFGNPGTSESPIMHELQFHPEFKYVLVFQEGVAIGMADAYSRATGKPAFVNLHIETGLGNAVSLMHNAREGGSQIVLSAGNLDIREYDGGRTDLVEMVEQFTKFSGEATHPDQVFGLINRAFHEAATPPTGPSFVSFSANALDEEGNYEFFSPSPITYGNRPSNNAITDAIQTLKNAKHPAFIVGDRISQSSAWKEIVELSDLSGAAVYASSYSEMNFPNDHPNYKGEIRLGYPEGKQIMQKHDVVFAVGKLSTGYWMFSNPSPSFFQPKTKFVHIDVDSSNLGSYLKTDIPILSDPKTALEEITNGLSEVIDGEYKESASLRTKQYSIDKSKATEDWKIRLSQKYENDPISAERLMADASSVIPTDSIIVNDAVTSGNALMNSFPFNKPGSLYGGRGGALGWGMGGALGIQLANPDKKVIAFCGDGSALMTIQGLLTASKENIPITYIVCNNSLYRVLKVNMNFYRENVLNLKDDNEKYMGMEFGNRIDIHTIAKGMNVNSWRIDDPKDIKPRLVEAINSNKPSLLDVTIDGTL